MKHIVTKFTRMLLFVQEPEPDRKLSPESQAEAAGFPRTYGARLTMASRKIETEEHSAVTDLNSSVHHARKKPLPGGVSPENQQLAKQIGRAFRDARTALSMTQEQVADLIHVTSEFYARLERGHGLPSVNVLAKLSKALAVSADDILGDPKGMQLNLAHRAAQESPELRSALDEVSKANPSTIRIVTVLVNELERLESRGTRQVPRIKSR